MRGREFIMKDGYSFHVDDGDADREYWRMFEAYKRIFARLGVKFRPVEADSGAIGGSFTHEFHVLAGSGEDAILSCSACEYTSNAEKTEAPKLPFAYASEPVLDLQARAFSHAGHPRDGGAGEGLQGRRARRPAAGSRVEVLPVSGGERRSTWDVGLVLRSDHEPNTVKVKNLIGADSLDLVPLEEAETPRGHAVGLHRPGGARRADVRRSQPRGRVQPDVRREQGRLSPFRVQAGSRPEAVQGISRSSHGARG